MQNIDFNWVEEVLTDIRQVCGINGYTDTSDELARAILTFNNEQAALDRQDCAKFAKDREL